MQLRLRMARARTRALRAPALPMSESWMGRPLQSTSAWIRPRSIPTLVLLAGKPGLHARPLRTAVVWPALPAFAVRRPVCPTGPPAPRTVSVAARCAALAAHALPSIPPARPRGMPVLATRSAATRPAMPTTSAQRRARFPIAHRQATSAAATANVARAFARSRLAPRPGPARASQRAARSTERFAAAAVTVAATSAGRSALQAPAFASQPRVATCKAICAARTRIVVVATFHPDCRGRGSSRASQIQSTARASAPAVAPGPATARVGLAPARTLATPKAMCATSSRP